MKLLLKAFVCVTVALWAGPMYAADAPPKTVTLQRLVVEAPGGARHARIGWGVFCETTVEAETLPSSGEMDVAPYLPHFRRAFSEAGLSPQRESNLFENSGSSSAEYALGGIIRAETYKTCQPYLASALGKTDLTGSTTMTIDWQLYSRLENRLVAKASISSTFSSKAALKGGFETYVMRNFEENVKLLAADPAIRAALSGPAPAAGAAIKPPALPPIAVPGALAATPRPIDQASKSVVVIFAGEGSGSGVLISREGFILTDAHVVGDAASVRLRWADGKTAVATVLRTSKSRDVALLKADATGYEPLPVRATPPPVGSTVFAIGAPEGEQFEGTLTRGIVSAVRDMDGLSYIQSDVTTGPGGSGGPLLDETGYVVGLTVLAIRRDTTSSGLNFFTPVKDVIDFLALDLR
jgi:S1-C subfamily serine protease